MVQKPCAMDFVYFLRVLLKRKWIIIGAGLLAAAIAYFLTRNELKSYRSTVQVSTGFTVTDEIKVNENFNFYEADTKFNNVIVTCTSPSVLSLLSYKLILHDLTEPVPFRNNRDKISQFPHFGDMNLEKATDLFRDKLESMSMLTSFNHDEKKLLELLNFFGYDHNSLANSINVYRLQRTDYFQIDCVSENPNLSAFVVNNLYDQFLRYYKSVRFSKSQESIDTLRSLMEKKKQDLDIKNALLREQGVTDVNMVNTSKLDIIANLEKTLTDEKSKRTKLIYSLQKIDQKLKSNDNSSVNESINNNDEILLLKKTMSNVYLEYLKTGSTDQALLNRYNQLKASYQEKMSNYLNTTPIQTNSGEDKAKLIEDRTDIEMDIQATTANIESIEQNIAALKGNIQQSASKGAYVETLLKELELTNREYLAAKQRYNDALDINSASINNFRQILKGQPAIEPEPSKRKLIVGMAGAGAIVITLLVITVLTFLDSSIKTPAIFSRTVGLKMLGMLNLTNLKKKSLVDIVAGKPGDDKQESKRINVFRESVRKLRYEIERSGKHIFLFTSTKKGQGKTTIIQALSYSMSLSKKKILIIDTNFCNNDLTVQMEAEPVFETIAVESGDTLTQESLLQRVKNVSKNASDTVYVIGSEGGDYTPSEVLTAHNLLTQLPELQKEFDYIFLEGPPLNDFSDSRELSQYVEAVIAIFSAEQGIKQLDKESVSFLNDLNGKFYGAILNKVDLENVNVS